ncbi:MULTISPECIES: hypothetical protein [Nonomuraea]|uniref:Uncharacterized protein n=1 Tax=Nonomuraea ferruginea TaxID=46174 RepID=A0ABT4STS1_9ACTN|nr:hypothetical protein [Nonomuraea ferruginea]MDA0640567.1 hypothetical protein [Nonomuraea ferruginea]
MAMVVSFSYDGIPITHLTEAHLEQHLTEAEALIAPSGQQRAVRPFADP